MHKLGRTLLWFIPFTWPIAIWRSFKAGQRKRDARMVAALGGDPSVITAPEPRRLSASPASLLRGRRT